MNWVKLYGHRLLVSIMSLVLLQACGGSSATRDAGPSTPDSATQTPLAHIFINQLGYRINGSNPVWIKLNAAQTYQILDRKAVVVAAGTAPSPLHWAPAQQVLTRIQLPALAAGEYTLRLDDGSEVLFAVAMAPWAKLHDAAVKNYYYNRASTALLSADAGPYARPAGHLDTQVRVHTSAASATRPADSLISASRGWYDAGDYNKYVVNAGISTYTLLLSYQHFAPFYANRRLNIPESAGALPDVLAEIKWNLDWLQAMQDPADGGVYHKLTSLNFNPMEMPSADDDTRYVVQKTTAATLNFAALMAVAARVYKHFDVALAEAYKAQAISAYAWASAHPTDYYRQPSDVSTGEYGDDDVRDEFFWAATELFITTGNRYYWQKASNYDAGFSVPSWASTASLGLYSLLLSDAFQSLTREQKMAMEMALLQQADGLVDKANADAAMGISMTSAEEFVWGSNAVAMNQAMLLLNANRLKPDLEYARVAENLLHYVLGTNPTGYTYVTGFGTKSPLHVHHRISEADGIAAPIPGMLAGGPQPQQQDKCAGYPSNEPALSYLDQACSYSTNEIAINWNAPLVYVLASFNQ